MRKAFALLLLGLSLNSTLAFAVTEWANIVIGVGRWMYIANVENEKSKLYQVRVQGVGATEEQARNSAFALAVDQAVGSLVLSEAETSNRELLRHSVLAYNSGYIEDFATIDRQTTANGVKLVLDVLVRGSDIANRIAVNSKDKSQLAGQRASVSIASVNKQTSAGDAVLLNVLNDYPTRSFDIAIQNVAYEVIDRNTVLSIDYTVKWSQAYLDALTDTVDAVAQRKANDLSAGMTFTQVNCVFCKQESYKFDSSRGQLAVKNTLYKQPRLLATLYNQQKQIVGKSCFHVPSLSSDGNQNFLEAGISNVKIYTDSIFNNRLKVHLLGIDTKQLDTVDLKIVAKKSCPR
jgi:hypothetical protein